jgi:hypothetical protein
MLCALTSPVRDVSFFDLIRLCTHSVAVSTLSKRPLVRWWTPGAGA